MDNETLERYLLTIGKRTYINCFYLFQKHYNDMNNQELGKHIPEYDTLSAKNSQTSLTWKASAAVGIFKNGREFEALKLCLSAKKLDNEILQKAKTIFENENNKSSDEDYQITIEKSIKTFGVTYKKKNTALKKQQRTANNYIRDLQAAAYAKEQAGYKCEFDKEHKTFISDISNEQYVEAHHLIPMKYQDQYEYSLDIPENIIALCPNCHRAIHHGVKDCKREIICTLFDKRKKLLENNGINVDIEKLLEMYM